MSKEMKHQYKQDLIHIRRLINEWDPMGLIQMGAPEDEYDTYSAKVLSILHSSKSRIKLKESLQTYLSDLLDNPSSIPVGEFTDKLLSWFCNR
ncbi:hypothetical protein [Brevibacillus choshinensis]|uniref:hypothetical protein n=1 Tax=Brevibacillus choshinensis TaxID=54911 RepID=UPI002E21E31B|nr:hypothetical protein [Brevibacillus choshinensis]MED4755363.1 hypothetical protein [Brevibacillus choshinensis]MED4783970.1 hypothetical protein [Brevibacillus choshinensis]